jgi:hypothetical protein
MISPRDLRSASRRIILIVLIASPAGACVRGHAAGVTSGSAGSSPSGPVATGSPPVPSAMRPNVLVIVADDQRWDTLSVMPKTDRWIRDAGVTFPRAMVATPLCCPSRSSIFIGDYAHNTGVHDQ